MEEEEERKKRVEHLKQIAMQQVGLQQPAQASCCPQPSLYPSQEDEGFFTASEEESEEAEVKGASNAAHASIPPVVPGAPALAGSQLSEDELMQQVMDVSRQAEMILKHVQFH